MTMKPMHMVVVDLIREVGVIRLGNFDGCACCRFSVRDVDVEVGCGKGGERAVWVSSPSLEYWDGATANGNDEALLRPIAEEVVRQVSEADGRGPLMVYLHEFDGRGTFPDDATAPER
jgi:hypothetical protein